MTMTTDPQAVGMSAPRLERIGPAMRAYVDRGVVAGINTMVIRRDQVVHAESLGWRDSEADRPMTSDTIFRIYSMTKPVIATALMLLHEQGKFQLRQPVAAYLPAFGATKVLLDGELVDQQRPLEIRDLLTHTSGLTYDFLDDSPVGALYRQARIMNDATRTLAEVSEAIAAQPLSFQPGTHWRYSVGIDVAAHLIEVLADQPLGSFLADNVFGPLGMTDTGFGVAESNVDRLAAMYGLPDLCGQNYTSGDLVAAAVSGFNEHIDVSTTYPTDTPDTFVRGGLGLFSTIGDYSRFAQMLLSDGRRGGLRSDGGPERLFSPKTLELMHANHLPAELMPFEIMGQPFQGYGFGLGSRVLLDVGRSAVQGSVGEFGWAGAAKTYYWVDPAEDLVGLFMTQYMTGPESPDADFRSLVYQAILD